MVNTDSIKIAEISQVSKYYGKFQAVNNVSFDLNSAEVLSILGPNGAGKTTLINMMLGRLSLSSGQISILGQSPGNLALKRQCGVMLQIAGLPDMTTIKEQIQLFRSYYPNPMEYDLILEMSGLKDLQNTYCKNLSGGQKQRLLFALSICGNPKLLFLDEPSTGLDITVRKSLWKTINQLKSQGTSIVLTTHYLEEADFLSDRIIMLNQGQIVQHGTPDEIKMSFNNKNIRFISPLPIDKFSQLQGVKEIKISGQYYEIQTNDSSNTMQSIFKITDQITDLTINGAALEDAFLSINKTGEES